MARLHLLQNPSRSLAAPALLTTRALSPTATLLRNAFLVPSADA